MQSNIPGFLGGMLDTETVLREQEGQRLGNLKRAAEVKVIEEELASKKVLGDALSKIEGEREISMGNMAFDEGAAAYAPGGVALTGTPPPLSKPQAPTPEGPSIAQKELANADKYAKIAKTVVKDSKAYATYSKLRDDALASARSAQKDEIELKRTQVKEALDMFGAVDGEGALNTAAMVLNHKMPGMMDRLGFQKNPMTGRYQMDADRVRQLKDLAISEEKRLDVEAKRIDQDIAAENLKRQKENLERQKQKDVQDDRHHQENLSAKKDENDLRRQERLDKNEETKANRALKHTEKVVQDIEGDLQKDSAVKNFSRLEAGIKTAESIGKAMVGAKGYDRLNTADATSLYSAYSAMKENYRSRVGGAWEDKQAKQMNGMFQNIDKWFGTIANGTPILSRDNATKIINNMREMHAINTEVAFVKEYKAIESAKVRDKNGEAATIVGKNLRTITPDTIAYLAKARGEDKKYLKDGRLKSFKLGNQLIEVQEGD